MSIVIRQQQHPTIIPASSEESIYAAQQVPPPPPLPSNVGGTPRGGSFESERRPSLPPKNYQHLEQIYANVPPQMMQMNKQKQLSNINSGSNLIQAEHQSPYRGSPDVNGQREAFKSTYIQPTNLGATYTQSTNQGTPLSQQANQNTPISQPANQNTPHVQVHFFHKNNQKARAEEYQRFLLSKINVARYTGIIQTTLGAVSFVIGILMPILLKHSLNNAGFGIWCGVLTIIAGALSIAMGYTPDWFGTRCAALTFCVFTIVCSFLTALLHFLEFGNAVKCDAQICSIRRMYNQYYGNYRWKEYNCSSSCDSKNTGSYFLSLLLALTMVAIFILSIINAVITARGCCNCCDGCCHGNDGGDEVFTQGKNGNLDQQQHNRQPTMKTPQRQGTVVAHSNQAFDNIAMVTTHEYPQQTTLSRAVSHTQVNITPQQVQPVIAA
eukprot:TCONS_00053214-protein